MTDGPSLSFSEMGPPLSSHLASFDLDTFAQWIEFQPVSTHTHVGLLELIANDLSRHRNYPAIAGAIKQAAKDLQAMAR